MEGPRLKRRRTHPGDYHVGRNTTVTVDLEDEDDDVIFVSEETGVAKSSTSQTATILPSGRSALVNIKQSTPLSLKRKSAPVPEWNAISRNTIDNSPKTKLKQIRQINQSTIQTSLTDFFQSKNPQPAPISSSSMRNNSTRKLEISRSVSVKQNPPKEDSKRNGEEFLSAIEQSINQPKDQIVASELIQSINQSTTCVATLSVDIVSALPERKIGEVLNLTENNEMERSGRETEENFGEEEDFNSGDEFLSNIPEEVFLNLEPAPLPLLKPLIQPKMIPKKPILTGEFKNKSGRKCPFYKTMPGTPFSVDAFNFGYIPNVNSYFLSHFHSDHYIGMTSKFQQPVYCSRITANLVKRKIRTHEFWVRELPMATPTLVEGVQVTLLEANHCPGSCLFLFKLKDGRVYLHTGDFRADPQVLGNDPALKNLREISKLYLDTTYLDPYYDFESQAATVEVAAEFAREAVAKNPKTLIVCGTYSVGKEKIFMRIAEVLKSKVAVTDYKMQLMECFEWPDFEAMLTKEWNLAQVHVLPMQALKFANLQEHLKKFRNFDAILAIVPSGWQFNNKNSSLKDIKPKINGAISILGLPYSEHSSYRELEWFVRFIKPKEVIPTVNVGNPNKREEMSKILKSWLNPAYKPASVKKQNLITGFFQP